MSLNDDSIYLRFALFNDFHEFYEGLDITDLLLFVSIELLA